MSRHGYNNFCREANHDIMTSSQFSFTMNNVLVLMWDIIRVHNMPVTHDGGFFIKKTRHKPLSGLAYRLSCQSPAFDY